MEKQKNVSQVMDDINNLDRIIKTFTDYEAQSPLWADEHVVLKIIKSGQARRFLSEYREYLSSLEVEIH